VFNNPREVADDRRIKKIEIVSPMSPDKFINSISVQTGLITYSAQREKDQVGFNLIRIEKVTQIILQHGPFSLQIVDVMRDGLGRYNIFKVVAFAEIYLHKPGRQHHALRRVLHRKLMNAQYRGGRTTNSFSSTF